MFLPFARGQSRTVPTPQVVAVTLERGRHRRRDATLLGRHAVRSRFMVTESADSWRVHDEADLGSFGRGSLKRVSVDLPDGTSFDQYVILLPEAVVVAPVDAELRVLMIRRHRFVIDRWVWECPGGYVDETDDDLEAAAVRELLEETALVSNKVEPLVSFQPMVGSADALNHVFVAWECVASGADRDVNEAGEARWFTLDEASELVMTGDVVGAGTVVALSELARRNS